MSERWIKLYEKIENSSIYHDSEMVHLWVHLLIKATKFPYKVNWGGDELELQPGELITGRKKLSADLKIHESKVQRALKFFEKCLMIEQRTNRQSRIVTILNWDLYQSSEQRVNNARTTSEQRSNTNKKDRKKKEEGKNKDILKPESVSEQTWQDFLTHRSKKKATVTQTVLNGFKTQADLAGWSLENAFIESMNRGWTGFKADWVNKDFNNNSQPSGNGNAVVESRKKATEKLLRELENE